MSVEIIAMRDAFFNELYEIARKDKRVILIVADCGAPSLDKFRDNLESQYFTAGIAEQNMITVAAGLALEGKIVYTYAIAPFASLRCYEQIKVDLSCMNLPVTIAGVGAGFAYDIMGPTHHATEDISIMRALPDITILNPSDSIMASGFAKLSYETKGPKYIRFDRGDVPLLYASRRIDFSRGFVNVRDGRDLCIFATGIMVHRALEVAQDLLRHSIDAAVVDIYQLKPINEKMILGMLKDYKNVITLEEHFVTGGLGSAIAEIICDNDQHVRLKRIGICDKYYFDYGGRDVLHRLCSLDRKSVVDDIAKWIGKANPLRSESNRKAR